MYNTTSYLCFRFRSHSTFHTYLAGCRVPTPCTHESTHISSRPSQILCISLHRRIRPTDQHSAPVHTLPRLNVHPYIYPQLSALASHTLLHVMYCVRVSLPQLAGTPTHRKTVYSQPNAPRYAANFSRCPPIAASHRRSFLVHSAQPLHSPSSAFCAASGGSPAILLHPALPRTTYSNTRSLV